MTSDLYLNIQTEDVHVKASEQCMSYFHFSSGAKLELGSCGSWVTKQDPCIMSCGVFTSCSFTCFVQHKMRTWDWVSVLLTSSSQYLAYLHLHDDHCLITLRFTETSLWLSIPISFAKSSIPLFFCRQTVGICLLNEKKLLKYLWITGKFGPS